jgi:hypothetical protein
VLTPCSGADRYRLHRPNGGFSGTPMHLVGSFVILLAGSRTALFLDLNLGRMT